MTLHTPIHPADRWQADLDAALELAADLPLIEASKFVRGQTGLGLREAHMHCIKAAGRFPNSALDLSVRRFHSEGRRP